MNSQIKTTLSIADRVGKVNNKHIIEHINLTVHIVAPCYGIAPPHQECYIKTCYYRACWELQLSQVSPPVGSKHNKNLYKPNMSLA